MINSYILYSLFLCVIISIILYYKVHNINYLNFESDEKFYKRNKWFFIWKYSSILYALIGCTTQQTILVILSMVYFLLLQEKKAYLLTLFIVSLGTWLIECSILGTIFYIKTTLNIEINIVDFLISNIIIILIWLIPNYVYFSKRRTLLSNK